jgi:NAD-dependent dihydropyrimidine dehydrogenase PreA subunit
MAYVITTACIDVKDGACVQCCPVDCIYEGERTLYIHPDECIDCGVCVSACPTQAIYEDLRLPPELAHFTAINREFFGIEISALGSPGGAEGRRVPCDHPRIAQEAPSGRAVD